MNFSWYGLLIGLSFLLFWHFFEKTIKTSVKISDRELNLAIGLVASGALIGARLYHLITDWHLYQNQSWWEIVALWNGGLGIFGAMAGGLAGLVIWKKIFKPQVSWAVMADAAAISLPLAQALGRWGNYLNQELFGQPSSLPWAITIDSANRPELWKEFSTFHPLFLYESLFSLSLFIFFWYIQKKYANFFSLGSRFYLGYYLISYGSVRFSLEALRYPTPLTLSLTSGQWSSIVLVVAGLLVFSRVFPLQWRHDDEQV